MTACTCHPGNTCTSASSCAAARRVEFGENEMPEFVTAIDYADNLNDTTTNMIDVRVPIGTRLALRPQAVPMTEDKAEALIDDLASWADYVDADHAFQTLDTHVRQTLESHGITAQGAQGGEADRG